MNILAGPTCPADECDSDTFFVNAYLEDANGYHVGHEVTCKGCERHWRIEIGEADWTEILRLRP